MEVRGRYDRGMSLVEQVRADRVINRAVNVVTEWASLEAFLSAPSIPAGIQSIDHNGLPIDLMFHPRGEATTVVTFHGATDDATRLPMLIGGGLTDGLPVNRIYLSDPTLVLDKKLRLAWYSGSTIQPRLQHDLDRIVDRLLDVAGGQHAIFFGTSGGGFAALRMSHGFPGSVAMVVNPQTSIGRYIDRLVDEYVDSAWGATSLDELPGIVQHDLLQQYSNGHSNTIAYLQNQRDWFHIANHQRPFVSALPGADDVWFLEEIWGDEGVALGHMPPPKDVLRGVISELAVADGEWGEALARAGLSQT